MVLDPFRPIPPGQHGARAQDAGSAVELLCYRRSRPRPCFGDGWRALAAAGEIRKSNKIKKGQMVGADYTIVPSVTFTNQNAGSISGFLGMIPVVGGVAAQVAGQINTKSASTTLLLDDNRSSVQIASSTGSARNMDIGAVGSLMTSHTGGSVGGYADTPEGKVIVAAFQDSLNNLVTSLKQYKAQHVKGGLGNGGQLQVD